MIGVETVLKNWKRVVYILLTYVATSLLYSMAGYIYRSIIGKEHVFPPLIGIPLALVGWPWMLYADLKHVRILPQDVAAFLSIAFCFVVFAIRECD